jgi:hypothetical protein
MRLLTRVGLEVLVRVVGLLSRLVELVWVLELVLVVESVSFVLAIELVLVLKGLLVSVVWLEVFVVEFGLCLIWVSSASPLALATYLR